MSISNDDDDNGLEAALIDSYFLPGGILDPSSFENNDNDEEGGGDNMSSSDRKFPFARNGADALKNEHSSTITSGGGARISTSISTSQNPWATTTIGADEIVEVDATSQTQRLAIWDTPLEDAENKNRDSSAPTAAAGLIGGSRRISENDASPWQSSAGPTLRANDISSQIFFDSVQGPNDMFRTIAAEKESDIVGNTTTNGGRFLPMPSADQFLMSIDAPEYTPRHNHVTTDVSNLVVGTTGMPHDGQLHNTPTSPLKVKLFPTGADNVGGRQDGEATNDALLGLKNTVLKPPPPPGFAPPPGFETTIPDPVPFQSQIPINDSSIRMPSHKDLPEEVDEESIHDNLPMEMLHTRQNDDERSFTASATSSLSELTSCGDDDSESEEAEDEEDEPNDSEQTIEDEIENDILEQPKEAPETVPTPDTTAGKEVPSVKDPVKFEGLAAGSSPSTPTSLKKKAEIQPSAAEQSVPVVATPNPNGQSKVSNTKGSSVKALYDFVYLLFQNREEVKAPQVVVSPPKPVSRAKRKKMQKKASELDRSKKHSQSQPRLASGKDYDFAAQQPSLLAKAFQPLGEFLKKKFPVFSVRAWEASNDVWKIVSAVIFVASSFLLLILKNALLEILGEESVYLENYVSIFLIPRLLFTMMGIWSLPHWLPHFLSCVILFYLCQERKYSFFRSPRSTERDALSSAFGKKVLLFARCGTPVMFFLDGFAKETGALMSLSLGARLVCAYIFSLFTVSCPLSPVGWFSCALQILAVYYCPSSAFYVEMYLVLFGMASIRYVVFLASLRKSREKMKSS